MHDRHVVGKNFRISQLHPINPCRLALACLVIAAIPGGTRLRVSVR